MAKYIQKTLLLFLLCIVSSFSLFSQSTFSGLDLNSKNTLIFTEEKFTTSKNSHKNLYSATIQGENLSQAALAEPKLLTCYPEKMDVLCSHKKNLM